MSWKVAKEVVKAVYPIPNADNIEVAVILGWECVVRKGTFKSGDIGIYIPIDSIVPETDMFKFMEARHYKVRTAKLRGQLSQGLLMPIGDFNEVQQARTKSADPGQDISEILGIVKYEKPVPFEMKGSSAGYRPSFLKKTDQERIQNIPQILELLRGERCELSEKADGSSYQAFYNDDFDGKVGACSRNYLLTEGDPATGFWITMHELEIKEKLKELARNISVQGELVGPGIQKNPYRLNKVEWLIFDIWDIDTMNFIVPQERRDLTEQLGLTSIPIMDTKFLLHLTLEEAIAMADGSSLIGEFGVKREGIVFKFDTTFSNQLDGNPAGELLSFKAVSNKYLLKHGE